LHEPYCRWISRDHRLVDSIGRGGEVLRVGGGWLVLIEGISIVDMRISELSIDLYLLQQIVLADLNEERVSGR
jgi:hypothetical protein